MPTSIFFGDRRCGGTADPGGHYWRGHPAAAGLADGAALSTGGLCGPAMTEIQSSPDTSGAGTPPSIPPPDRPSGRRIFSGSRRNFDMGHQGKGARCPTIETKLNPSTAMPELIDLTIPPADAAAIQTLLTQLEAAMPYLVGLSADQVKALFKLGPRSEAFVMKALIAAELHPRLLPRKSPLAAMQRDAALRETLRPIRTRVATLLELIDGTMMLAGADLMKNASVVYRVMKISGQGQGVEDLVEDLGQRFTRGTKLSSVSVETLPTLREAEAPPVPSEGGLPPDGDPRSETVHPPGQIGPARIRPARGSVPDCYRDLTMDLPGTRRPSACPGQSRDEWAGASQIAPFCDFPNPSGCLHSPPCGPS